MDLLGFANFIAKRFVTSHRGHRYFSWITTLSITGISISVASMITVLSVIDGFESELKRRLLVTNAHIMLYRYPYGLENHARLREKIEDQWAHTVTNVMPFIYQETAARRGSLTVPAIVRDQAQADSHDNRQLPSMIQPPEALTALLADQIVDTSTDAATQLPPVVVGTSLMHLLSAKIGDDIEIISPSDGSLHETGKFRIVGTLNTGMINYDRKFILMARPRAQDFFHLGSAVTGLEISLKDAWQSTTIGETMAKDYSLDLKDWQSLNKSLFDAMQTERVVIALIISLVSVVASFNILTTMFVTVSQKQRDISILKSLGARNGQIAMIFISQGLLFAFIGSLAGCLLAFILNHILSRYDIVKLPDVYILNRLPIDQNPMLFLSVTLISLVLAVLASAIPAWIAARIRPSFGFQMLEVAER